MKRFFKVFALLTVLAALLAALTVTVCADDPVEPDLSFVFLPETQLTVYVDGAWSDALSNICGYGESVTLDAPATRGNKSFSHWEADGSVVSYANPLKLTVNANTTLYAVYAASAPEAKPVAGFISITLSTDGESIVLQAKASEDSCGFVYSTAATGDALVIGGSGVTNVAAVKLTDRFPLQPLYAFRKANARNWKKMDVAFCHIPLKPPGFSCKMLEKYVK